MTLLQLKFRQSQTSRKHYGNKTPKKRVGKRTKPCSLTRQERVRKRTQESELVRTKHGEADFSCYAAQVWKQLHDDIKGAPTVSSVCVCVCEGEKT